MIGKLNSVSATFGRCKNFLVFIVDIEGRPPGPSTGNLGARLSKTV